MSDKTNKIFLCQCHDVTLEDVTMCWEQGIKHPEAIKRATGITMGGCQGKLCQTLFAQTMQSLSGESWPISKMPIARPPLYPIRMGAFAGPTTGDNNSPKES